MSEDIEEAENQDGVQTPKNDDIEIGKKEEPSRTSKIKLAKNKSKAFLRTKRGKWTVGLILGFVICGIIAWAITIQWFYLDQQKDIDDSKLSEGAKKEIPVVPRNYTIDEIIAKAGVSKGMKLSKGMKSMQKFRTKVGEECFVKIELDIMLTCAEWDQMQKEKNADNVESSRKRTLGMVPVGDRHHYWERLVPYYFEPENSFTQHEKNQVHTAARVWSHYSCLLVTHQSKSWTTLNKQPAIAIISGSAIGEPGCWSHVGRQRNKTIIRMSLDKDCFTSDVMQVGVILHEFGHAIGFWHEHNRPDRDQHITIIKENIPEDWIGQYTKMEWNHGALDMGLPYDYESIMHYGQYVPYERPKLAMVTKNRNYQNKIGQRLSLSFLDAKAVNKMYKCAGAAYWAGYHPDPTPVCGQRPCPGEGFRDKDCNCLCNVQSFVEYKKRFIHWPGPRISDLFIRKCGPNPNPFHPWDEGWHAYNTRAVEMGSELAKSNAALKPKLTEQQKKILSLLSDMFG